MTQPAIQLDGVSKRYTKYDDRPLISSTLLSFRTRTTRADLWALQDVDLHIRRGEAVGIIGRNGSGKTTMLAMLAGVTAPTRGHVRVRGRVAPLIAVGVGFHLELTGRENVYVNGIILGLSRREIDQRLEEIVEFSGLERFIDTPVKFYSSGMFVRLGFSVAVSAQPDVLLVDEVLAVGDLQFQLKCYERMTRIREAGTTVVVVSHNLNAIRGMCDRAVLLEGGRLAFDGEPGAAISAYHEATATTELPENMPAMGGERAQSGVARIEKWDFFGVGAAHAGYADTGATLGVSVTVRALQELHKPFIAVTVQSESGIVVYLDHNRHQHFPPMQAGEVTAWEVRLPLRLPTGTYSVGCVVHDEEPHTSTVLRLAATPQHMFYVAGRPAVFGVIDLGATFGVSDGHALRPDDSVQRAP